MDPSSAPALSAVAAAAAAAALPDAGDARATASAHYHVVELRGDAPDPRVIAEFEALYVATFPDENEREEPEDWKRRLRATPPAPEPVTHALAVVAAADGRVAGGLLFEHYRGSHCGLLTYLMIAPSWRRRGIGRVLVERALRTLADAERAAGGVLRAAFCETEDPREVPDSASVMPTCARLKAILSLGARILDLDYVQPPLAGRTQPCEHLLFLAFDLRAALGEPAGSPPSRALPGAHVRAFLHEFYRALGVADPDGDATFLAMTRDLADPQAEVPLQDWREDPALPIADVAVALHYVTPRPDEPPTEAPYPGCPYFQSMELDLMSYGYQVNRLLGSECLNKEPIPVEIHFPERVDYWTEGRHMLLLRTVRSRRARALVSTTHFLASGIRVWHVVLTPERGEVFSEYDVISLIHLYDGRAEGTHLAEHVRFCFGRGEAHERRVGVNGLLQALVRHHEAGGGGPAPDSPGRALPRGGTIQIAAEGEDDEQAAPQGEADRLDAEPDEADLGDVLEAVRAARATGDAPGGDRASHEVLKRAIAQRTPRGRALLALCGIVTGIFDFDEVDAEEVLDTLEPTFFSPGSLIRIHRCTLVSMDQDARTMHELRDAIGMSPYLLLPHAALLHNEALIEDAEAALARAAAKRGRFLKRIERHLRLADQNLSRFFLPNVFNYVTERTLFTKGSEGRGITARQEATRSHLAELRSQVEDAWERQKDRGQRRIAALLAVFSVFQIRDVVFDRLAGWGLAGYSWSALTGLAVVVWLMILGLWAARRPS